MVVAITITIAIAVAGQAVPRRRTTGTERTAERKEREERGEAASRGRARSGCERSRGFFDGGLVLLLSTTTDQLSSLSRLSRPTRLLLSSTSFVVTHSPFYQLPVSLALASTDDHFLSVLPRRDPRSDGDGPADKKAAMSSSIHDSKPQLASFHSELGDGDFVMAAVGLQAGALGMMDEYEDEEDSPYEEVRASVSNTDDPDMPVLTFRMWVIGLLLTVGSAAANTFFNFRNPQIYVISLPVLCVERAHPVASRLPKPTK